MACRSVASLCFTALALALLLTCARAQQSCTIGGSTRYCGYASGLVSGGFGSPCRCNPNFCCSNAGFCGPEPSVASTGSRSDYCGSSVCQAQYGNCNPGPSYFEYIGTGRTCGSNNCPVPDRVNQQATISQIPTPRSGAPLYFIVFLLSDQYLQPASGVSTGQFGPVGLFADGTQGSPYWDPAKIRLLASRGSNTKVMASIAGDSSVTAWRGVSDVNAYVSSATSSLRYYLRTFNLAGFDINYEETINGGQQEQWLQAWSQIIRNLKQDGALITFAPYSATIDAYKRLQDRLSQQLNTNIDFVIYQAYSGAADTASLTSVLRRLQLTYAPTKIIAGLSNGQLSSNANLVSQVVQPLLSSGVITGAAVFDADTSSAASPAFRLEQALWNS